jgi:hypothetical protein
MAKITVRSNPCELVMEHAKPAIERIGSDRVRRAQVSGYANDWHRLQKSFTRMESVIWCLPA